MVREAEKSVALKKQVVTAKGLTVSLRNERKTTAFCLQFCREFYDVNV
jgi:hypothetical protein